MYLWAPYGSWANAGENRIPRMYLFRFALVGVAKFKKVSAVKICAAYVCTVRKVPRSKKNLAKIPRSRNTVAPKQDLTRMIRYASYSPGVFPSGHRGIPSIYRLTNSVAHSKTRLRNRRFSDLNAP